MHSLTSRANALFAFTLSTLAAVTFAAYLTTALEPYVIGVKLAASRVQVKNMVDYGSGSKQRNDLASLGVDVAADLAPLFNWNVKQLFLFLSADYETDVNAVNQVVLWDKIVLRSDQGPLAINLEDANTKYYFWDDGNGLKGNKNVTLTLTWNVIPNAGHLPMVMGQGSRQFQVPDTYTTGRL